MYNLKVNDQVFREPREEFFINQNHFKSQNYEPESKIIKNQTSMNINEKERFVRFCLTNMKNSSIKEIFEIKKTDLKKNVFIIFSHFFFYMNFLLI